MGGPQPAPLLTLLKPSTVAAYTAAGFWGDQTIYHLAARQARAMPQAFALRDRDRRLSYPELVDAARIGWRRISRATASAPVTASPCGCRAGSRPQSRYSRVRATAICAAHRCTAITEFARSSRLPSACAARR